MGRDSHLPSLLYLWEGTVTYLLSCTYGKGQSPTFPLVLMGRNSHLPSVLYLWEGTVTYFPSCTYGKEQSPTFCLVLMGRDSHLPSLLYLWEGTITYLLSCTYGKGQSPTIPLVLMGRNNHLPSVLYLWEGTITYLPSCTYGKEQSPTFCLVLTGRNNHLPSVLYLWEGTITYLLSCTYGKGQSPTFPLVLMGRDNHLPSLLYLWEGTITCLSFCTYGVEVLWRQVSALEQREQESTDDMFMTGGNWFDRFQIDRGGIVLIYIIHFSQLIWSWFTGPCWGLKSNRTSFGNHSADMIQIHNFITDTEPALKTILLTQFRFITSLHKHWDINRASVGCPNYLSICLCGTICGPGWDFQGRVTGTPFIDMSEIAPWKAKICPIWDITLFCCSFKFKTKCLSYVFNILSYN